MAIAVLSFFIFTALLKYIKPITRPSMNRLHLFFSAFLCVFITAQQPDDSVLRQNLLFRPPVTLQDHGLQSNVKKVEITTSYSDKAAQQDYRTLYFSDTGLLLKNSFHREKEDELTVYYHYDNGRLDSITSSDGTGKEVFSYDSTGRLIRKSSYGKYEDNKNEIDETEEYHYNKQGYIIQSVRSNFILECNYTADHQIREVKSYYTDQPSDISSTVYQYKSLKDRPDLIINKKNGRVQETTLITYDHRKNAVETVSVYPDKTRITVTSSINYDDQGNISSCITSTGGKKTSTVIQKTEYISL